MRRRLAVAVIHCLHMAVVTLPLVFGGALGEDDVGCKGVVGLVIFAFEHDQRLVFKGVGQDRIAGISHL